MVEATQAEICGRRTPIRGYGQPVEQVLPAFQTPWVQAQLDHTPWRRGMYGECTHTPRPQVVSVSVEWWLRTSEMPSGLTTSGNQNPLLRWQPLQPGRLHPGLGGLRQGGRRRDEGSAKGQVGMPDIPTQAGAGLEGGAQGSDPRGSDPDGAGLPPVAGGRGASGRPQPEVGGFVVHSAAAGARGTEGPRMESVHRQVPKKSQAGGGLERGQRDLTPAEERPPRALEEKSGG